MDKPCKYCGHIAARQNDEDCPQNPVNKAPGPFDTEIRDDWNWVMDDKDRRHLLRIKAELYAPEPLTGDKRRDLANLLDNVIISNLTPQR